MNKCNLRYQLKNQKAYMMFSNFQKCFRQLASHLKGLHRTGERDQRVSQFKLQLAKLAV